MKRYIALVIVILGTSLLGKAQELYSIQDKAEDAFDHLEYAEAAGYYTKLLNIHEKQDFVERLATCYYKMKDYSQSITWLKKALLVNSDNETLRFYYAEAIQHQGNYEFAITQYNYVKSKDKNLATLVALRIKSCQAALEMKKKPGAYSLALDSVFNTQYSEFSPILWKEGVIFASDRPVESILPNKKSIYGWTNTHYINLFFSQKDKKGKFSRPKVLSDNLISAFHTGSASISPDQKLMIFTRTESIRNPNKVFKNDLKGQVFVNRLQLFFSHYVNGSWTDPKPFPYNKVSLYSVGHPSISPDGKILYFASDMPGGKGGIDLYYAEIKSDGTFGKPINLGDSINTAGNEEFPNIGLDHQLYFSSDGWPGMGGLDVFKASGSLSKWTKPQNLGTPLNSSMDDFSMVPTDSLGSKGYLASNRSNGIGSDDIYDFHVPVSKPELDTSNFYAGRVINAETGEGIPNVTLEISQGKDTSFGKFTTDSMGYYNFPKKQSKEYILRFKKPNYFTQFDTLWVNDFGILTSKLKPIHLVPMVVNKPIRLENIYYDFNSWQILPQAARILDGLVKVLKDNPEISINLDSHTDTRGDSFINKYISVHRAQAAVEYLISQGINPGRLKARGFGKDMPLVKCDNGYKCTDEDHQLNRRTEFSITRIISQ